MSKSIEFINNIKQRKLYEIALINKNEKKDWIKYLFPYFKGYQAFNLSTGDTVVIFKQKYLKRLEELDRESWKYNRHFVEVLDFVKITKDYNCFKMEYLEDKLLETVEKYKKEIEC